MPQDEGLGSRAPRNRDNFFWIRHCAALGVLIGHSYALVGKAAPAIFGEQVHTVALKVFFIISGYLVCKSWERDKSVIRYLTKRILRIFPGLILVVLITAFVIGPVTTQYTLHEYFSDKDFRIYFWNMALAPNFHLPGVFSGLAPDSAVNGSLWSLPVEFALYLLIPVLSFSGRPVVLRLVNIILVVVLMAASVFYQTSGSSLVRPVIYWTSVPYALQVAAFFACASWYQSFRLDRFLNLQVALALALLMQLFAINNTLNQLVMLLGLPYIVLAFGLAPSAVFATQERWGDASYGIYLYAFPIQQCTVLWLGKETPPVVLILVALPFTLAFAFLSWHIVEKRALRWKPRLRLKNSG